MDNQEMVFNAARDGDLHRLKKILDGKSRNDISSLVSARTNDSTPLIMACKNGHLDAALYLIGKCKADIEQLGSVQFGEDILDVASPLWFASAAGHLSVVKMLVKYNADVNDVTNCFQTALYGACSYGQLEIAKFLIQEGADIEADDTESYTCLMIACWNGYYEISKYLLDCGAGVNRKSDKGDSALKICAQFGYEDIFKMLLKYGAKSFCDSYGTTPLLTAALEGHSDIVEYCIRELNCTKQDKVNALELLGSFVMKDNEDTEKAFEYWKRAMELRYEGGEFPLEKPITRSPIASCVDATEVRTLHQLEELVTDPEEMCIQALLIVERIIGLGHPHAFYYIALIGGRFGVNGNNHRYKKLWMYVLDMELKSRNTHSRRIVLILSYLTEVFSFMMVGGSLFERGLQSVSFLDILDVFKICLIIIEKDTDSCVAIFENDDGCTSKPNNILITAIRLVRLMCMFQPLNIDEDAELKKVVYALVCLNPKGVNGSTLLHLACSDKSSSYYDDFCVVKFPSTEVVDILLEVGACLDAVDASNNTPLHVAAMNKPFAPAVFKTLVNHGAHLDFCNNERKNPFQLTEGISSLDIYPMHYINLQCLCAQTIRRHEIVYVGYVPKDLEGFLDSH